MALFANEERASCGVGFAVSRSGIASREILRQALHGLKCVEHRGASGADGKTGDGAGVMTDIPTTVLGISTPGAAVATLFLPQETELRERALETILRTFAFFDVQLERIREVPVRPDILGQIARQSMPHIAHVILSRPAQCRSDRSFNELLYRAKQRTLSRLKAFGLRDVVSFVSLSTSTVVYKALVQAYDLERFYPDLERSNYRTRFALFHRRFSTNTKTTWDKAQPFRLCAHNGEINTIASNRSWSYSREQAMGLRPDELLTHEGMSDSGSLNEMVEALQFRSSIPHVEDILAIMMPPATGRSEYYQFWGRAMEPWDGPAFVTYATGNSIGARLDRNGFRPCRWTLTEDAFYLASEAGIFDLRPEDALAKGSLAAGTAVKVTLGSGKIHFRDPSFSRENKGAHFDPRLIPIASLPPEVDPGRWPAESRFGVSKDEIDRVVKPMILAGKEPIGSMGDTACLAVLSDQPRSLFDYFVQDFAQVTNPPLDYLRESMVTDLSIQLGRRPNIFAPKELIPPAPAFSSDSPVLSLGEVSYLRTCSDTGSVSEIKSCVINCWFASGDETSGTRLETALKDIASVARARVETGQASILILSHRDLPEDAYPVPSLLALRSVVTELNRWGLRLGASIVLEASDVLTTHHLACSLSFGATAVCPVSVFKIARNEMGKDAKGLHPDVLEARAIAALEQGLLKVMSKIGISVVRSYQSSRQFTAVGLGQDLLDSYFPGSNALIGGLSLQDIAQRIVAWSDAPSCEGLPRTYLFKEHNKGEKGERHSMTVLQAKRVHAVARATEVDKVPELMRAYLDTHAAQRPVQVRDLLEFGPSERERASSEVMSTSDILSRFGSGAMSFGAISADAQRDIFVAMKKLGARSNSGEGGENPYYWNDGVTASTKQIASGRFGVTAEYLSTGNEIEIKIAQGAKPGEGGQLMGHKVSEDIARARFATAGVDLISPPPLHDIYSIEDLRQLIYELKQLRPDVVVCVKLVSGKNIGTIATGVVKAGADVIQISGSDGGTGAATVTSMRHAGLPWEFGLADVHQHLVAQGLRSYVRLRVDGGISCGEDILVAAALGAQEFGFGKLALIAQGCIMARICENNRCPTGIATHDPKFKSKYKGSVDHIVQFFTALAEDVRARLGKLGLASLDDLTGRGDLLAPRPEAKELLALRGIDLSAFLKSYPLKNDPVEVELVGVRLNPTNQLLLDCWSSGEDDEIALELRSVERAVMTRLAGHIGRSRVEARRAGKTFSNPERRFVVRGSAGQGFGSFLTGGCHVTLLGEANDALAKSMSGGTLAVRPHPDASLDASANVIAGNCLLYGATGGSVFISGLVGDRFAVRNSGARAVVEGAGLHACEYMTGGIIAILGPVSFNVGAGMTGGEIFIDRQYLAYVNEDYVEVVPWSEDGQRGFLALVEDHVRKTQSALGQTILNYRRYVDERFVHLRPIA